METLVQIDAYDPVADAAVTLFACSHDDPAVCHAQGGTWWPTIAKLPVLRYDLFDGAFGAEISSPGSSIAIQTEPWPNFGRYSFADARFRLWTGDVSVPSPVWTLRFDGRVTAQPESDAGTATIAFAVDDRWLDAPLLATYAGTTGAEGPAAMKGQAKPLALGAPRYVAGKLIDSLNSVFQISAYGAINAVEVALERLVRFGAPVANYASYAALVAATIAPGTWATANAVGMVRFGAPTTGQISFLVNGDQAGPDGWARKPGQLIRRIALISGGAGKIDDASLDALDVARPYNVSLYVDEQTTARELIQQLAASVNAVAGVSWLGKLFVAPIGIGSPALTLAADGSSLPPVASVRQIEIAAPWQKLALGAERAWTVHALSDIAFSAPLLPLGLYVSTTIYREGNLVDLDDGSQWLYINTAPSSGNAPPTSGTANAWWSRRTPPTIARAADGTPLADLIAAASALAAGKGKPWFQSTAPTAVESGEQDLWFDTGNGNYLYRRLPGTTGRISYGGTVVKFGGNAVLYRPWSPAPDQRITQALAQAASAIAAAQSAQATADEAIDSLEAMADDGLLTAVEKKQLVIDDSRLQGAWSILDAQAALFGITTERTAAATARTDWLTVRNALSPAWNDVTADTPVVRATFVSALAAYDAALTTLQKAISAKAATTADWNGVTGTGKDQLLADTATAKANAASALLAIGVIQSDGYLSAGEKPDIIRQRADIEAEYGGLVAKAAAQGVSSTTYQAAYAALIAYLNGLSPAWNNTALDTAIVPATFNGKFSDYYFARTALFSASADLTAANQPSITGPSPLTFSANYLGALDSGQAPRDVPYKRLLGTTDVTTASAWSVLSSDGVTLTVGAADGVANITAVSKDSASFILRSVHSGVTRDYSVSVQRSKSPPPVSTGGSGGNPGTTGSTNVSASTTATTYGSADSASFTCVAGTAGQVALAASLNVSVYASGGVFSQTGYAKWQWRAIGGSWADVGSEIASNGPAIYDKFDGPQDTTLDAYVTKSGLTSGTTYEFRMTYRKGSGTSGQTMSFSGVGTGVGS